MAVHARPTRRSFSCSILRDEKKYLYLQHRKLLWFRALVSGEPPQWPEMFKETNGDYPLKVCATFPIEVFFFYILVLWTQTHILFKLIFNSPISSLPSLALWGGTADMQGGSPAVYYSSNSISHELEEDSSSWKHL